MDGTTPSEGTEYALFNTTGRRIKNALWGSRTRTYYGSNAAVTLAAGGQINLVRLEVGQVVLDGRIFWDALGASTQVWLGHSGDCDAYKTQSNGAVATLSATTGNGGGDCSPFNNKAGIGYEITASTRDVIFTNSYAAATSALSAGAIKVVIQVGGE